MPTQAEKLEAQKVVDAIRNLIKSYQESGCDPVAVIISVECAEMLIRGIPGLNRELSQSTFSGDTVSRCILQGLPEVNVELWVQILEPPHALVAVPPPIPLNM